MHTQCREGPPAEVRILDTNLATILWCCLSLSEYEGMITKTEGFDGWTLKFIFLRGYPEPIC